MTLEHSEFADMSNSETCPDPAIAVRTFLRLPLDLSLGRQRGESGFRFVSSRAPVVSGDVTGVCQPSHAHGRVKFHSASGVAVLGPSPAPALVHLGRRRPLTRPDFEH
eukprot:2129737-Prymnesium_polylepis.2